MPDATVPALLSVLAVSLVSFAGASVLALGPGRLRRFLPALVALAAGALLGDTFLHLLPEAVEGRGGFTPGVAWGVLGGLLAFFAIEQVIHWHHHGEDIDAHFDHDHGPAAAADPTASALVGHGHVHEVAWMNLLGDFLHNLIDGMLIAGTWLVSPEAGIATTIAVALHEIPQEFGDFGVLLHAGLSPKRALLLNFGSALAAVLGGAFVLVTHGTIQIDAWIMPIASGGFLYIACADLVPELRRRAKGKALLGVGLALAAGIGLIALVGEITGHTHVHGPGHEHDHVHGPDCDH
jgi:zinc and cadmium transporter